MAVMAAVTATSLTLSGCVTDTFTGTPTEAESTRSTETQTFQANTQDVQFIEEVKPRLQSNVTMSEQLLATEDVPEEIRTLAQTSLNRQQDEIIQLNSVLEQWNSIEEDTGGVAEALPEEGSAETGDRAGRELEVLPDRERPAAYLDRSRDHLVHVLELAQEQVRNGESVELRDLAEVMISVKNERLRQIDELLEV